MLWISTEKSCGKRVEKVKKSCQPLFHSLYHPFSDCFFTPPTPRKARRQAGLRTYTQFTQPLLILLLLFYIVLLLSCRLRRIPQRTEKQWESREKSESCLFFFFDSHKRKEKEPKRTKKKRPLIRLHLKSNRKETVRRLFLSGLCRGVAPTPRKLL